MRDKSRSSRRRLTPKQRVLKEWPSAWFNKEERTIEGYSQGLVLGRGNVIARSVKASAWADAAKRMAQGDGQDGDAARHA